MRPVPIDKDGACELNIEIDDLCAQSIRFDVQPCEGDGKLKSTRAGAAWVQEEHAAVPLNERLMRVTGDNRRDGGSLRIEV